MIQNQKPNKGAFDMGKQQQRCRMAVHLLRTAVSLVLTGMLAFAMALSVSAQTHTVGTISVQTCYYLADHAVYQSEKPFGIWGTADGKATITAELYNGSKKVASATAKTSGGAWSLELPGQKGGYTPYSIKLTVNGETVGTYQDILFGELWLASGQSNMQLRLRDSEGGLDELAQVKDSNLRFFQTGGQPNGSNAVTKEAMDVVGVWKIANNGDLLRDISTVAYYFAKELRKEVNVPVAVVETSMGSTPIEAWLSEEILNSDANLSAALKSAGVIKSTYEKFTDVGTMYLGKILPLSHLSIKGTIWYQGESNAGRPELYAREMELLQENWSELFGFKDHSMPFIYTQLAPYTFSGDTQRIKLTGMMDAMREYYEKHSDVAAMVTIYDLSLQYTDTTAASPAVIHPTVKKPVGERMAAAAKGLVYGKEEATAPILKDCKIEKGIATLTFDHVGGGLKTVDGAKDVLGFALCAKNGTWVNADATITGKDTVQVSSRLVHEPLYVSYAYNTMNTDGNLACGAGIPAAPFSTGGVGGLGARSYLNCEDDLFVVTSFETTSLDNGLSEVGHAEYQNPWTVLKRSKVSYDTENKAQGAASVKMEYTAGESDAIAAMNLRAAGMNSYTIGLQNIKTMTVKVKNGDDRAKKVRLRLTTYDGSDLVSAPCDLEANADFTLMYFDLSKLYASDGTLNERSLAMSAKMIGLGVCVEDTQDGTVWIDDFKLGVDTLWVPGTDLPGDQEGKTEETVSKTEKDKGGLPLEALIAIPAAVVVAAGIVVAAVLISKKKNKNAVPENADGSEKEGNSDEK